MKFLENQPLIRTRVKLSMFGRRALIQAKEEQKDLNLMIDLFLDALKNTRYRDFSNPPHFYYNHYGQRVMQTPTLGVETTILALYPAILKKIRLLGAKGFSSSWLIEESLYFEFCQGLKI